MKRAQQYIASAIDQALGSDFDPTSRHDVIRSLEALVIEMNAIGRERSDPMREIMARLGDRWSTLLLIVLRTGGFRHATLKRLVALVSAEGQISQRMLTLRLRALERDGLIDRLITPTVPPRVDYSITPLGLGLLDRVDAMMDWVRVNNEVIRANRQAFDRMEG